MFWQNWLRNRNTIEFLGVWEHINNPAFKPLEFEGFKTQAGLNSFVLTATQWIDATGAIGLLSQRGRHGGTFAHKDIAFEFASWVSVEFKLYLIKEFQRLKIEEGRRLSTAWDLNRTLSKLNYRIHTDAVKTLIPPIVTPAQAARTWKHRGTRGRPGLRNAEADGSASGGRSGAGPSVPRSLSGSSENAGIVLAAAYRPMADSRDEHQCIWIRRQLSREATRVSRPPPRRPSRARAER